MAWFFALSLPGLVVLLIVAGIIQLVFFRHRRQSRPGAASIGFDLLDTALRPGREHSIMERERKKLIRLEAEEGEPPLNEIDLTKNRAKILRLPALPKDRVKDKADEDAKGDNE